MSNKKAFDTGYTSVPVYYPDELCLVGGKDHISDPRERGPLDTKAPDEDDSLYRPRRLEQPFKIGFVESIDADGVQSDISIVLRDGVPCVEYGQMRTRGARVVNFERKKKAGLLKLSDRAAQERATGAGYPLESLRCSGRKARGDEQSLSRIIAENNLRHDDTLETALTLMARLLDKTNNNYDLVARQFGVKPPTIKSLMKFKENATKETKQMVAEGRIGITAAALLAAKPDPKEQNKLLAELLAAPDQSVRRAAKIVRGADDKGTSLIVGKRQLNKFKDFVTKERDEEGFYDGVLAFIDYQVSGKTDDERLKKLIAKYGG